MLSRSISSIPRRLTKQCFSTSTLAYNELNKYIKSDVVITENEKELYRKNGFIKISNALSDEQLKTWREMVDHGVYSRGDDHIFPQKNQFIRGVDQQNTKSDYYHNVFIQRINLWQNGEEMCELVGSAGYTIGRIASELEGVDGMRLHHDQALYKEAFANATAFHLDVPFWTFDSFHGCTCWVALDDVTMQNGCLCYIVGSHKMVMDTDDPYQLVNIGNNMNTVFDEYYPQCKDIECIAVEVNAGDMLFHNGLIIHGNGCNLTNITRRAMTFGMFPDGTVFNGKQNVLTDEQFNKLKVGDMLNDINQNPVLYSTNDVLVNHDKFY